MKLRKWLENWDMTSLKIKAPFLEMDWAPQESDKNAAWEMYIELLTRITTQSLLESDGDEQTALSSVYSLFPITREVIRREGRDCQAFTKIAIIVLNQIIRPFTAKWHKLSLNKCFENPVKCVKFREELKELQILLKKYSKMLANMAEVEDLTDLQEN